MGDLLYDYYPTLSKAKEAVKRIRRKGHVAVIRKVFMSDTFVVYIKEGRHPSEYYTREAL